MVGEINSRSFVAHYNNFFLNQFNTLGLSSNLIEVLNQLGFLQPTPIQEQSIPVLLNEKPQDFIGLAQTGTGKTAAFGLPLIDLVDPQLKKTQALILAPTRELGQQTATQLKDFASNNKAININVVYGGASITNQIKALQKPTQIIVATPGRLIDLIHRNVVDLSAVKYLVLDEADEMLNMGFKEAIDEILEFTEAKEAIWLFSATMPQEIRQIVKKYMHNPVEVAVNAQEKSNKDIAHKYVMTKTANKLQALKRFLDLQPDMRGVMFCRTKRETQEIADTLSQQGYGVEALHGDLSQAQRDAVMRRFKGRKMQLLIATDVAARGIDVSELSHVIHHSLPDQLESYTHRSGRTGRAGRKGISLAFINPREGSKIAQLEKKISVKFEQIEVPSTKDLKASRLNDWVEKLQNADVHPHAEDVLDQLKDKLLTLSREDILKKLISAQLDLLSLDDQQDLNETPGQSKYQQADGEPRFFVNIGQMDGFNNQELVDFLADVSGVKAKHFSQISMQKSCSYFSLSSKFAKDFGPQFDLVDLDGREIRVNRDDQGNRGSGKKKRERGQKGFAKRTRQQGHAQSRHNGFSTKRRKSKKY